MSEMIYGNKMEGSSEYFRKVESISHGSINCIDQRNESDALNTVKTWIEKYIKPELKEHAIVSKKASDISDKDAQSGIMHMLYVFASRFGLNAKISNSDEGCLYSFWYPCED